MTNTPRLLSVNVARPRLIQWQGATISTGIFKQPVRGRVRLRTVNLDGDKQADLSVHGGRDKAVYVYPSEHYEYWRRELGVSELSWGAFGENFTSEGLLEDEVQVGDRFRIGTAVVMVTQPRVPCFKLAARFQREDIIARFLHSDRSGFYLSVIEEGEVGGNDRIEAIPYESTSLTIRVIHQLYRHATRDRDLLRQAAAIAMLPEGWRRRFAIAAEEAAGHSS